MHRQNHRILPVGDCLLFQPLNLFPRQFRPSGQDLLVTVALVAVVEHQENVFRFSDNPLELVIGPFAEALHQSDPLCPSATGDGLVPHGAAPPADHSVMDHIMVSQGEEQRNRAAPGDFCEMLHLATHTAPVGGGKTICVGDVARVQHKRRPLPDNYARKELSESL